MQAGKISKINKRAGGNKAVQVGIFQKSLIENHKNGTPTLPPEQKISQF